MPNYISLFLLSLLLLSLNSTKTDKVKEQAFDPDTEKQNFENIAIYLGEQFTHIFPNYNSQSEPFESENAKIKEGSTLVKTQIFENRSGGEHMFNLEIKCALKTREFSLKITDAKVKCIENKLGVIDWNEFNSQISGFQAAISNALMNKMAWRGKEMKVILFQDVKSELLKKVPNLEIIPHSNPGDNYNQTKFSYYLKIKDSYIGNLYLHTSMVEDVSSLENLSLSTNSLLHVGFDIAKDGTVLSGELSTPVVDKNSDSLKNLVSQAVAAIDIKNQFNDFASLSKIVKNYLEIAFPEISIETVPNDQSSQGAVYEYMNLSFETGKMELYLGSSVNNEGISQYTLMADAPNNQFSNPYSNFTFSRSSEKELGALFNQMGLNSIFMSVFQDVMNMFSSGFEQVRTSFNYQNSENQIPALEYYTHSSKDRGLTNKDVTCFYKEHGNNADKKATLEFVSKSKDLSFKKTFKIHEYNRNTVYSVMELFFKEFGGNSRLLI